jgi:homoserine kinase
MGHPVKVFAPASVANVAVGYDILGFALERPGDDILVRAGSQSGLVISEIKGGKGKLPLDVMKNTAGYAAHRLMKHLGVTDEPIEMIIHKKMPFGSGMGSSAASAVGGVYAVNEYLNTGLTKSEILRFAVEGEEIADGAFHADNVAPSLLGGMILIRDNPTLDFKKIHLPQGLFVAMIHPHIKILTKDSRDILSDTVPLELVIRQSGNLAAFIAALYTSDLDLLGRCIQDVIIEPQRSKLIPHFNEIKEKAMIEGALGFSISGAGPAMFALCSNSLIAENIVSKIERFLTEKKIDHTCFVSKINNEGAIKY